MIFEKNLVGFYGELVNVVLKWHINSRGRNIYLSDDLLVMILIQFEVLPQTFLFYLQVANMVNFFLRSHKLLAIFTLGFFYNSLTI